MLSSGRVITLVYENEGYVHRRVPVVSTNRSVVSAPDVALGIDAGHPGIEPPRPLRALSISDRQAATCRMAIATAYFRCAFSQRADPHNRR
jgi:hypothetical protein